MEALNTADRRQATAEIINEIITPERVLENLKVLQSPAPTGTVLHTRTPIIARLLEEGGVDMKNFTERAFGTRSPAVFLGPKPASTWFDAHADQPTYIPKAPTNADSFDILPICAHRPKPAEKYPEFPAAVLRYNPQHNIYEKISEGAIGTQKDMKPYYVAQTKPRDGFKPGYDRIVYTPTLAYDPQTDLVVGNIDNPAGIAASAAAISALAEIAKQRRIKPEDLKATWLFPDEEEGLPEDPAYFSREARRIGHRAAAKGLLPEIIVNVDGHDTVNDQPPGTSAVYGAYVSGGKGPIVPPDIYSRFDRFLRGLGKHGVQTQPTESIPASLSRSDDAGYMDVHDQIIPVGYLVRDPHHNRGIATANLKGLVNVAKAMAWIAAEAK